MHANRTIYLDNFSTTLLAPEAAAAMVSAWSLPTNAGSPHALGARAADLMERARAEIADLIGAAPSEIYFTSGATEANNMALLGVAKAALAAGVTRNKVIVSSVEHKSVLMPAVELERLGFQVSIIPADSRGVVDMKALAEALDDETLLVSVMGANNETGVVQPLHEVAGRARGAGALIHSDCAQLVAKCPVDVFDLDVDYLSISSHKIYGPMGVGALYISASAIMPAPLTFGGGQQGGIRSGTEPIPLIAGFGAAAKLARAQVSQDAEHARSLRDAFLEALLAASSGIEIVTVDADCLPGSLCLKFDDVIADELIDMVQKEISISSGSACNSGQVMPSHVLSAMGFNEVKSRNILRIYFGRYNSIFESQRSAAILAKAVRHLQHAAGHIRQ